jgi:hypothetical protein
MTEVKHRSPRVAMTYRRRIKGKERAQLAGDLRKTYDDGATIRALAEDRSMSYGTVRKLLLEAGAELRGRGGRVPR